MPPFETTATVADSDEIHVSGLPFQAGTEVNVTISPKRQSAEEFSAAWQRLTGALRREPHLQNITDEDIQSEVDRFRAGE